MADRKRLEAGLATRRKVLGDAHVDRSLRNANEFAMPMQELVAEYCWGDIWNRPGLELRDRSLLNIGMLTALARDEELSVHVRGALNNGLTRDEIREALLQAAIYCGVPAAINSFRIAQRVIEEVESESADGSAVA